MSMGREARVSLATAIVLMAFLSIIIGHAYYDRMWRAAFETVAVGDAEEALVAKLGPPTAREKPDKLYPGYATENCVAPCVERLWYESLIPGLEAWSISLGSDRRVSERHHWSSP